MTVRILLLFLIGFVGTANGQLASNEDVAPKVVAQTSSIDTYLNLRKSLWSGPEKELSKKDKDQLALFVAANNTGSFEFHFISFINSTDPVAAKNHLETATAKSPQNPLLFLAWIDYAASTGNNALLKENAQKLKNGNVFNQNLLNYTKDVLRGLPQGAFLVVNGKEDTYPVYILQHVDGYRKDVTVVQLDLFGSPSYRNELAKKMGIADGELNATTRTSFYQSIAQKISTKPIALAFTLPPSWLKKEASNTVAGGLFLCAPSYASPAARVKLFNEIQQHPKGDFAANYLPFLFYAYQEFSVSNTELADKCKAMIVEIAKQTSNENAIMQQLTK
ncbi:MAG: hypothetical protein GC193_07565 [Cryomorphaceae bacterium]|nr:hypothetical protein [Cryomorphaceae bacterium]